MTVQIKHPFENMIADDPAAALAGKTLPSHWNADHDITMATAKILGRLTASTGPVEETTIHDWLDLITNTEGKLLARGASLWEATDPTPGVPVGTIFPIAHATLPTGYLFANGQQVSRTTYAALWTLLGTLYGAGDGTTTFNLPDYRGRAPFGVDSMGGTSATNRITSAGSGVDGVTNGATGGGQSTTLTNSELPSHTHTASVTDPGHHHVVHMDANTSSGGVGNIVTAVNTGAAGNTNNTDNSTTGISVSNSSTGGGTAFSNMPPAIITNFIIKY